MSSYKPLYVYRLCTNGQWIKVGQLIFRYEQLPIKSKVYSKTWFTNIDMGRLTGDLEYRKKIEAMNGNK